MQISVNRVIFPIGSIILFLIVSTISYSVESYPIKDSEKLICPDSNPVNCYPKLFEAKSEWKTIKEGQVIEAGLEIKMNMDTLEKEARLDPEKFQKNNNVVGIGSAETNNKGVVPVDNAKNNLIPKGLQNPIIKSHKKGKAYLESSGDFHGLMNYVIEFVEGKHLSQYDILIEKLEELSELCSDIDFGIDFIDNLPVVLKLTGLYDSYDVNYGREFRLTKGQYDKVKEVATRCLSSSLRNNGQAQSTLSKYLDDKTDFLLRLIKFDSTGENLQADVLLLRRRLGVLGAVLNNNNFFKEFSKGSPLKGGLLDLYDKVDDASVRQRVLQIFDDLKQQDADRSASKNIGKRDLLDEKNDNLAKHIEDYLINSTDKGMDKDVLNHLKRLEKLKKDDPNSFKASSDFLEWLSNQIYFEKTKIKKRDLTEKDGDFQDERFVDYLISLRHEVFGNKLGSRKHYLDEL